MFIYLRIQTITQLKGKEMKKKKLLSGGRERERDGEIGVSLNIERILYGSKKSCFKKCEG